MCKSMKPFRAVVALTASFVAFATPQNAKAADITLEMAYMPIVPCAQLFVIVGIGWAKAAGINLKLTRLKEVMAK